jgi:dihydropteroate synthase
VRFSRGAELAELDARLGPLACALEARAEGGTAGWNAAGARARVVCAPAALSADELLSLQENGAELTPLPAGLARLALEPARLHELAAHSRAARCLAAALDAAAAPFPRPRVMGVLNVTPDSFSDGGAWLEPGRAIEHGLALASAGADIVDVGGESSRPGSRPIPAEVEIERVLPVIAALARDGRAAVSVDTTKASVARAALDAGATVVNDVSAGRNDPAILALVAERRAGLILMHMQGTPGDMQRAPRYHDVVREVAAFLRERASAAWQAGVEPARIALDPGLGFGKLLEHNLALLRALPELRSLGFPLCVGASRKSFLGRISGEERPERRVAETTAAVALSAFLGAEIHRVHDVAAARSALGVAYALASAETALPG